MKKTIFLILVISLLIFFIFPGYAQEGETVSPNISAEMCHKIIISYTHGQGIPGPLSSRPDYNYETEEFVEIKQIITCVNRFALKPYHNNFGSADGVYLSVKFENTDDGIFFDRTTGYCRINEESYKFERKDYEELTDLIYSYKTKNDIKVYVNDRLLKPAIAPQLISDRTMLPVCTIADAIDAETSWNRDDKSVTISKDRKTVCFFVNQDYYISDNEIVPIDVGARMSGYAAMIPVRALAELFECTVEWRDGSVHIYTGLE